MLHLAGWEFHRPLAALHNQSLIAQHMGIRFDTEAIRQTNRFPAKYRV